jgi:dihydroorotate dehydrogenase electron transfer subunit
MNQQSAKILWNRQVAPDCYRLGLECPQRGYGSAYPGQFVMVRIGHQLASILRRPFSIFGLVGASGNPDGIELLYKVVGKGTQALSELPPGKTVDLVGPLGRGFKVDLSWRRIYLAAGGIGIAPIRFLAVYLKEMGADLSHCRLFLGGRNHADLLCRDEFGGLGIAIQVTTDDGSAGDQCLVTDPLAMAVEAAVPDMLYACGPQGMLQCITGIVEQYQVSCQLSIETIMACGMGACLGCAVESSRKTGQYLHVCMNGPVFKAADLVFGK